MPDFVLRLWSPFSTVTTSTWGDCILDRTSCHGSSVLNVSFVPLTNSTGISRVTKSTSRSSSCRYFIIKLACADTRGLHREKEEELQALTCILIDHLLSQVSKWGHLTCVRICASTNNAPPGKQLQDKIDSENGRAATHRLARRMQGVGEEDHSNHIIPAPCYSTGWPSSLADRTWVK